MVYIDELTKIVSPESQIDQFIHVLCIGFLDCAKINIFVILLRINYYSVAMYRYYTGTKDILDYTRALPAVAQ